MADIVNLRRARKAKARSAAADTAAANRAKFGQTKGEKVVRAADDARLQKDLAHRKLDPKS